MAAGCYEAEFPLGPANGGVLDPKLIGTWRCLTNSTDDDEVVTMTVARARAGVYAVSLKEKGEAPDNYEAHTSQVGGQALLNMREIKTPPASKPWSFGRVTSLRADAFDLQIVAEAALKGVPANVDAVRKAIERQLNDKTLFEDNVITCVRAKAGR